MSAAILERLTKTGKRSPASLPVLIELGLFDGISTSIASKVSFVESLTYWKETMIVDVVNLVDGVDGVEKETRSIWARNFLLLNGINYPLRVLLPIHHHHVEIRTRT